MPNQAATKPMVNKQLSLLQVVEIIAANYQHIILNFQHLQDNYQHQHIHQIPGTRDLNGNLIQPWLKVQDVDQNEYVQIGSFTLNRHTATLNMLIQRQVRLVKLDDATPITEVAGLLTNHLNRYNNYTIASDGEVKVREIKIKISKKKVFDLLHEHDIITDSEFDFRRDYTIHLHKFPLVDAEQVYHNIDGVFEQLAETKVLASIISAHLRQESDVFIPEQLESLSQHHLSKNFYINLPKTKDFSENITTRTTHQIYLGNQDILNLNKLHSANKFLNRMYRAYDIKTGEIFDKSDFGMTLQPNIAFRRKLISSRMRITAIDEFMQPIFDDFLSLTDNGRVAAILNKIGAYPLAKLLQEKRQGKHATKLEMVAALTAANTILGQYIEGIYHDKISPLVFYIGSMGFLPKNMQTKAMNSQKLAVKYPNLQFSSNEKQGKFFEIGDSIIGIYSKTEFDSQKTAVKLLDQDE